MKLPRITLYNSPTNPSSIDIYYTSTTYLEGFYAPVLIDPNGDIGFFIGVDCVYTLSL